MDLIVVVFKKLHLKAYVMGKHTTDYSGYHFSDVNV